MKTFGFSFNFSGKGETALEAFENAIREMNLEENDAFKFEYMENWFEDDDEEWEDE